MQCYCVYEENHGVIGIGMNMPTTIDGLIKEDWLYGDIDLIDENDNMITIKEKLGENWVDIIKQWDKNTFNEFFEGLLHITIMECWCGEADQASLF